MKHTHRNFSFLACYRLCSESWFSYEFTWFFLERSRSGSVAVYKMGKSRIQLSSQVGITRRGGCSTVQAASMRSGTWKAGSTQSLPPHTSPASKLARGHLPPALYCFKQLLAAGWGFRPDGWGSWTIFWLLLQRWAAYGWICPSLCGWNIRGLNQAFRVFLWVIIWNLWGFVFLQRSWSQCYMWLFCRDHEVVLHPWQLNLWYFLSLWNLCP